MKGQTTPKRYSATYHSQSVEIPLTPRMFPVWDFIIRLNNNNNNNNNYNNINKYIFIRV